jgi:XTP/dITP diphosphohydrolase
VRYVAELVAIAPDGAELTARGELTGTLTDAPRGSGGFGYDPLLYLPSFGRTVAELDAASKNRLSHRAQASAQMLALLRDAWGLRVLGEASASGR